MSDEINSEIEESEIIKSEVVESEESERDQEALNNLKENRKQMILHFNMLKRKLKPQSKSNLIQTIFVQGQKIVQHQELNKLLYEENKRLKEQLGLSDQEVSEESKKEENE